MPFAIPSTTRMRRCISLITACITQAYSFSLQGWGLIDLPLRASNEGLLRPRVARAKKIIRFHPPPLFREQEDDQATVYVLEERQIGQRSYPTRYVVLYQEQAFKRPGYRLSWMTVPDDTIKTAQGASLAEEKEEVARNNENEALKKRAEALKSLTKKKDE